MNLTYIEPKKNLRRSFMIKGKIRFLISTFSFAFFFTIGRLTYADTFHINFEEGDLPSLHPHILQGHARGRVLALLLYEGLTDVDESGNVVLKHAKNVTISDDQLTYIFEIHPRKWSDGSLITAHDYVRSWRQAADPQSHCDYSDILYVIKNAKLARNGKIDTKLIGIEALDDLTLKVELECPTPYFLKSLAQPLFLPQPKEESYCFNGPFMLLNYEKGERLDLQKNQLFWQAEDIFLSSISISFMTDANKVLDMYEQGELDFIGEPISRLSNVSFSLYGSSDELKHANPSRFFWIFLNTEQPPFNNSNIRKAFSAVLDRELITSTYLVGDIPLRKPLPKMLSHTDQLTLDSNQIKAKRLFKEGMNEMKYTPETFPSITLSHFLYVSGFTELAEYMQKLWSEIFSIPINLSGSEWNQYFSDLQKGNFQIGGCSFDAHCHDPMEFFNRFDQKDDFNFSKWVSSRFQKTLEQIRQEIQPSRRQELLKEAEDILLDEMPVIPVCTHVHYYLLQKKWEGIKIDPSGCVDFSRVHLIRNMT